MARMRIGHTSLRSPVGFGAGMEAAHPADLMGADAFRRPRHALRAEIRAVGEHAGQHSGDVRWCISRPYMGELVGKTGPFMHLPCGVTIRVPASSLTLSSLP